MNFLTDNAIRYTIRHFISVACPEFLNDFTLSISENRESCRITIKSKHIIFKISSEDDLNNILNGKTIFRKIETADKTCQIPVILQKEKLFAEIINGDLIVNADLIGLSFIMLSRIEEKIKQERDEFGNFEFKNSIAAVYDFIDFPIADEYAIILQQYLKILFPEINLKVRTCTIIPTHDIDEVFRFSGFFKSIKRILGDLVLYRRINSSPKSLIFYLRSLIDKRKDPYIIGVDKLTEISGSFGLISEFYFMSAEKSRVNNGYDIKKLVVTRLIEHVIKSGMVVGIHGSFETYDNITLMNKEKESLQKVCKCQVNHGRQHFLHFEITKTFRTIQESGLLYDSTLGYNEKPGFRCGTCHEYHPFDFENDNEMALFERPLIVMDASLWSKKNSSITDGYATLEKLYSRCAAVGGRFVILWHNAYVNRKTDWFEEVYLRFLKHSAQTNLS